MTEDELSEESLIAYASYVLRCQILSIASRESCILSTRLTCEMLGKMGIKTIPVVAHVEILNAAAVKAYMDGDTEKLEGLDPEREEQGLAIAYKPEMNFEEDENGNEVLREDGYFFGHVLLCAIGKDGVYLVDPSIDQSSRPKWDLHLYPLTIKFPTDPDMGVTYPQFLEGQRSMVMAGNGCALFYEAHMEDTTYAAAGDWCNPDPDIDAKAEDLIDSALALVQVAKDFGEFPAIPALPRSLSSGAIEIMQNNAGFESLEDLNKVLAMKGIDLDDVLVEWAEVEHRIGGTPVFGS